MTGSPPDVDSLLSTVARFRDYLGRNREASARSEVGVTSRFWRSTFDARANFPDVNGLLAFRRGSYTYGLADERQQDEAAERRYFERIAAVMRHSVSLEFVKSIPEPAFGAPYVFDYGGCARSASFVVNAATALHVSEELRQSGLTARRSMPARSARDGAAAPTSSTRC